MRTWKTVQTLGVVALIIGLMGSMYLSSQPGVNHDKMTTIHTLYAASIPLGFVAYVVGRFMLWFYH